MRWVAWVRQRPDELAQVSRGCLKKQAFGRTSLGRFWTAYDRHEVSARERAALSKVPADATCAELPLIISVTNGRRSTNRRATRGLALDREVRPSVLVIASRLKTTERRKRMRQRTQRHWGMLVSTAAKL
ncbi:uncharacterized protein CMC5_005370 [Chondromyces crocatus]|uniref:Uncharacterized protein n=1 Tax=Chondromyces crocatus TaxID=52 RepID=A0A0K1E6E0_CHOCO|nr:uncharacterized protein CMC5_005370 [Chondromyces crocatus]